MTDAEKIEAVRLECERYINRAVATMGATFGYAPRSQAIYEVAHAILAIVGRSTTHSDPSAKEPTDAD